MEGRAVAAGQVLQRTQTLQEHIRPPRALGLPTRAREWHKGHPSGDTVFDVQALRSSAFELELFLLLPEMRAPLKLLMRLGALALSFQLCVNCPQLVIIGSKSMQPVNNPAGHYPLPPLLYKQLTCWNLALGWPLAAAAPAPAPPPKSSRESVSRAVRGRVGRRWVILTDPC